LEDVARAASVTRTTLYRHFRTREELAVAAYEDNVKAIESRAGELAGADDGIVQMVDYIVQMQRDNRALTPVLGSTDVAWLAELGQRTDRAVLPLFQHGVAAQIVHPDVTFRDLMLVFPMAAGALDDSDRTGRDLMFESVRTLIHRALFTAH
jgi:Bacterial regulatory proteins, tetR family.